MESSRKLFSAILVLLLLLVATDEMGGPVVVAEAKRCKFASNKYRGPCILPSGCAFTCMKEGFSDGDCEGFLIQDCVCYKECEY